MDASCSEGLASDPTKCNKLSIEEKREIVYELSKWSDGAAEALQTWSRQEILQILCAEMGKERKYTGLTKIKIIENLLKIVSEKKLQEHGTSCNLDEHPSSENSQKASKRQRNSDHPTRIATSANNVSSDIVGGDHENSRCCTNSACRAKLNSGDAFCKRCSCCICHKYDDNKDPSLWLFCSSEPPFLGDSCGMSCHLECAISHKRSGIAKDKKDGGLDGCFCCISCGKVNDLLSTWRKQLVTARDTRRVDILCYRLSLGQKILSGTKHYHKLLDIVNEAVEKLEADVGPLTGLPVKKARGIVNRLSLGPEVQRLCASAVECLDSMVSERRFEYPSATLTRDSNAKVEKVVRFEDVRPLSLTVVLDYDESSLENVVGYTLWHRKADMDYPLEPTCTLFEPNTRFVLSGLSPATDYQLKVVSMDSNRELGMCEVQFRTSSADREDSNANSKSLDVGTSRSQPTNISSLSNASSVEDETNIAEPYKNTDQIAFEDSSNGAINCSSKAQERNNLASKNSSDGHKNKETKECVPFICSSDIALPETPFKLDNIKDPRAGSSSKKRSSERRDGDCAGIGDKDFEYYIKVIRRLECEGHIDTSFRQKFLTWFSLRASPQEQRIVKVFVDTFIEDLESLAGQLIDAFSDIVSSKRSSVVPGGFCTKLWH